MVRIDLRAIIAYFIVKKREIYMKIVWGIDSKTAKNEKPSYVVWDSQRAINAHMLLVGKSGTGKTHTLRKIISQLQKQNPGKNFRIKIIDVHGDIEIPGCSSVKFSESTPYGFNPLIINPDPDFGGIRKRIQSFLNSLNATTRQLGPKQEATLRNILLDLYAANGFFEKDNTTWDIYDSHGNRLKYNNKEKKYPTLDDAYRYANFKHKAMFLGTSNKAVFNLEELNKKIKKLNTQYKKFHKSLNPEQQEEVQKEISAAGEQAIESYTEYIRSIENGKELTDLIKYDSVDVMKSVVDRLNNLVSIGIFKDKEPPFDPDCAIWRYDIKALTNLDEKKLFVYQLLEESFQHRVQEGMQDDVVELIFLDEANLFFTDEPDNIINIISKEARKFGLGLCCASQSPTHFSEDFISNVATKIILGIDQMFWDGSIRKMKINQEALSWIVPHRKIIVKIDNKADLRSDFIWTLLPNK